MTTDEIIAELAWRDKLIDELRETLNGIAQADWRTWEELASPEEFVRWAKARAIHALLAAGVSKDDLHIARVEPKP